MCNNLLFSSGQLRRPGCYKCAITQYLLKIIKNSRWSTVHLHHSPQYHTHYASCGGIAVNSEPAVISCRSVYYFMPRLNMVNAHISVASSICLEVGFPAPCPACVSIRIREGLGPSLQACNAAANLKECAGTTLSS